MDNSVKIQDFLNELNRRYDATGSESLIYFVKDKDEKEYALKRYFFFLRDNIGNFSKPLFLSSLKTLKDSTDSLVAEGVNIPKIHDFTFIESSSGKPKLLKLEDKMPGSPIYLFKEANMGELGKYFFENNGKWTDSKKLKVFSELKNRLQKHNIEQQKMLLDATEYSLSKLVDDFRKIYTKPNNISLDYFPENFLFDSTTQKFSIIDLISDNREKRILGARRIVSDVIFVLVLSQSRMDDISVDEKLRAEMNKNNIYIQEKILNILEKEKLLLVPSEKAKEKMLVSVGDRIDNINSFANRVKILKK